MNDRYDLAIGAHLDPSFNATILKARSGVASAFSAFKSGAGQFFSSAGSAAIGSFGGLGAFAGGMTAGAIGVASVSLVSGMKRAAFYAIELGDKLKDAADMFNVRPSQMMGLTESALRAGTTGEVAAQGLSKLQESLSNARNKPDIMRRLRAYGVSNAQIASGEEGNVMDVALQIVKSIGKEGIQPQDVPQLKELFGKKYRQVYASLKSYREPGPDINKSIGVLDSANTQIDLAKEAMSRFMVRAVGAMLSGETFKSVDDAFSKIGARMAYDRNAKETADTIGKRTVNDAGLPNGRKSFFNGEFNLRGGDLERMGGATSMSAFIMRTQTLNIQKRQLEALESIDKKLGGQLNVAVGGGLE